MIPTTTEIAERLDDLMTHAAAWSRVLRARADRPGTPSQMADLMQGAASEIDGAARAFRWRAEQSGTGPFDLIRTADRALAQAPVLREVLELERDAAMTGSPDDASWFAHELTALQRLQAARRGLIALPPPGETPAAELRALRSLSGLIGAELLVEFDTYPNGATSLTAQLGGGGAAELPDGVEAAAAERAIRLADPLIRCEIPDWDVPPGASGRIRIGPEEPWLDAVDRAEEWLLERTIDLETLAEMRWEGEGDPSPEP